MVRLVLMRARQGARPMAPWRTHFACRVDTVVCALYWRHDEQTHPAHSPPSQHSTHRLPITPARSLSSSSTSPAAASLVGR